MTDARAGSLPAVRSTLRTLVSCFAAWAVLALVSRAAFVVLYAWARSDYAHGYGLLEASSTLSNAAFIALALTVALAIGRLGALPRRLVVPAKATAAKAAPYRASPEEPEPTLVVETAPALYDLPRWAAVAAWGYVATESASFVSYSVLSGLSSSDHKKWLAVYQVIGLSETVCEAVALTLLVVWMIRTARTAGAALPAPLAIAVLVLVAGHACFYTWRMLTEVMLPEWTRWLTTGLNMAIDVGMALTARGALRILGGLPPQEIEGASPDDDAEMRWAEAGSALERYTSALKVRIAIAIGGMGMGMLGGLSGSQDMAKGLLTITALAAAVTGVVMIVALARYARVPEDTRAGGPALVAVGLFSAGSLGELYTVVTLLQVVGESSFGRASSLARMAYAQLAIALLGVTGLCALLVSFSRLATSMGDTGLVDRCRSFGVLVGVLALGSFGLYFLMGSAESALLLAMVVLVVAVVVLVKYFGLLRDLRSAMAVRSGRKHA